MGRRTRSGLAGVIAFAIYALVFLVSSGILPGWAGAVVAACGLLALVHPGVRGRVRRDFGRYLRDARARTGRSPRPGMIEPTELPHARVTAQPASPARSASPAQRPAQPARAAETPPDGTTPGSSPSPELVARLTELRKGGRAVEAIEVLREATGMELYEASRFVLSLGKS